MLGRLSISLAAGVLAFSAIAAADPAQAKPDAKGVHAAAASQLAEQSARLGRLGAAIVEREKRLAETRKSLNKRRRAAASARIRLAGARERLNKLTLAAQRIAQEPTPAMLLNPQRPLDAARSAMLIRRLSKKLVDQRRIESKAAEALRVKLFAAERAEAELLANLAALKAEEAEVAQLQGKLRGAAMTDRTAAATQARAEMLRETSDNASALALALSRTDARPAEPIKLRRRFSLKPGAAPAPTPSAPTPETPPQLVKTTPQEPTQRRAEEPPATVAPAPGAAPRPNDRVAQVVAPEIQPAPERAKTATPPPKPTLAPPPEGLSLPRPETPFEARSKATQPAPNPAPTPAPTLAPKPKAQAEAPPRARPAPPLIPKGLTFAKAKGRLLWPAAGDMRRSHRKSEPGVSLFTAPFARVIAPWRGKVVYTGEFASEGKIVIIEPQKGYSILMTGMDAVDVRVGQRVAAGEPIGRMGGQTRWSEEFLIEEHSSEVKRSERLYMEIARNRRHLDPAPWFQSATERVSGL